MVASGIVFGFRCGLFWGGELLADLRASSGANWADLLADWGGFAGDVRKNLAEIKKDSTFVLGEMVEWSITVVLKTIELRGSGGSNPSLSADFFCEMRWQDFIVLSFFCAVGCRDNCVWFSKVSRRRLRRSSFPLYCKCFFRRYRSSTRTRKK